MRCLLPLLLAAACSAGPSSQAVPEPPPDLLGQWQIVALDSRKPVVGRDDRQPVLTFDEHGYGGYAGCNAFGGQGLAHEGRFYGGFALSTAMACGPPFDEQERSVQRLLSSGPKVEWLGRGRLVLAALGQRLELVRHDQLPTNRVVVASIPFIGTAWSFGALDGRAIDMPGARSGPTLIVEGDRFTLETPCITTEGEWSQAGEGTVSINPTRRTKRTCNPASREQSELWADAISGPLRYHNGPNGEILLAGSGHWMVGDLVRRGSSEQAMFAGRYEVDGLASASEGGSAKRPELVLTRNTYSLWDGCNRTEGLAIAFERQLFVHSSGLSTLASCLPGKDDPRLKQVVLAEPRIGKIAGGLVLSAQTGAIRLRRTDDNPTGSGGVTTALLPGMRFTLLGKGGGKLEILVGHRFRLTQSCGVTEGRWRAAPREVDGAIRFGPETPAGACERDLAARRLQQIFLGNVDVVIGPNRDAALFAGRFGAVRARLER